MSICHGTDIFHNLSSEKIGEDLDNQELLNNAGCCLQLKYTNTVNVLNLIKFKKLKLAYWEIKFQDQ